MKRTSVILASWLWLFALWGIVGIVQAASSVRVPESIQNHCLLTNDKMIDTCPDFREDVRSANKQLHDLWKTAELSWSIVLYDVVKDLKTKYRIEKLKQTQGIGEFIDDYRDYITQHFINYFDDHSNDKDIVNNFFKTTYFDLDQSGLSIAKMEFYTKNLQQYDTSVFLLISVRNFSQEQISNIEDIYCFSTISDNDYIYPLQVKPTFQANSISNLIVELKAGISPLLDKSGEKKLACTLVYTQWWEEKYTNWGTLQFDIKNK